jgi:hypothetical protein
VLCGVSGGEGNGRAAIRKRRERRIIMITMMMMIIIINVAGDVGRTEMKGKGNLAVEIETENGKMK